MNTLAIHAPEGHTRTGVGEGTDVVSREPTWPTVRDSAEAPDGATGINPWGSTSLKYVITGPGRSGTTFLARVFLEAGYDLGAVSPEENGENPRPTGGGLEHPLFTRINEHMLEALKCERPPEDIVRDVASLVQYTWPAVVKDPRYLATAPVWFLTGNVPQHLFLCLREMSAMRDSMQRAWGGQREILSGGFPRNLYVLLTFCLREDIPFTFVLYPRIGQDRAYAERVLGPFMRDAGAVVERVWDDTLCHQSSGEAKPRRERLLLEVGACGMA